MVWAKTTARRDDKHLSFGAPYIRDLTVLSLNLWHTCWCPGSLCHLIIIITIILIRVSHISLPNNPGQVNLGKWIREKFLFLNHIHGPWLVQERRNSIANALELSLSCFLALTHRQKCRILKAGQVKILGYVKPCLLLTIYWLLSTRLWWLSALANFKGSFYLMIY